jgi:hypothetical protein
VTYRSPWRWKPFVLAVEAVRRLLRPWRGAEERLIAWLVTCHNWRVKRHLRASPVRTVLLILPRCVKRTGCRIDVRTGLTSCETCAEDCPLAPVASLTRLYGVRALVAYRSHIAYRMAREERPDLILATACGDRLIKALRSVPEVPSLLTPLTAMERPCRNAVFELDWFREHLAWFGELRRPATEGSPGREAGAARRRARGKTVRSAGGS